jgi:hypothetical protein
VWNGTIGTLIAKARAKAAKSQACVFHHTAAPVTGIAVSSSAGASLPGGATRSKFSAPVCS